MPQLFESPYKEDRYKKLLGQLRRQKKPLPPETADLPRPTEKQWQKQNIKKETETKGYLDTLLKPLGYLGDVLSSGEYAVSSFLRSAINWYRGKNEENPFVAGLKGFASGFTSDEDYQVRISNVIEQLGWDPKEGSWENVGQETLGFLGGILLDPATYASFGISKASRFLSPKAITKSTSALKQAGLKLAKHFGKGQAFGKKGKLLREAFTQEAVNKRGIKNILSDIDIRIRDDILSEATDKTIKTIAALSKKGGDLKNIRHLVSYDDLKLAAKITGKTVSEMKQGAWRQLLDTGGLKFFGKNIISGTTLSPRTAGLTGLILGNAMKDNIPLTARLIKSDPVQAMFKPVKELARTLKKSFALNKTMTKEGAQLLKRYTQASAQVEEVINASVAQKLFTPGEELTVPFKIGREVKNISLGPGEFKPLTVRQQKLLGRFSFDAGLSERVQDGTITFTDWMKRNANSKYKHWLKGKRLSHKEIENMGVVADRVQDFLNQWRKVEGDLGLSSGRVLEYYTQHVLPGMKADVRKKFMGQYDWFNQARTSTQTWDELKALAKEGKIPRMVETDLKDLLVARVGAGYRHALEVDMIEDYGKLAAKGNVFQQGVKELNPEILETHPDLVEELVKAQKDHNVDAMYQRFMKDVFRKIPASKKTPKRLTGMKFPQIENAPVGDFYNKVSSMNLTKGATVKDVGKVMQHQKGPLRGAVNHLKDLSGRLTSYKRSMKLLREGKMAPKKYLNHQYTAVDLHGRIERNQKMLRKQFKNLTEKGLKTEKDMKQMTALRLMQKTNQDYYKSIPPMNSLERMSNSKIFTKRRLQRIYDAKENLNKLQLGDKAGELLGRVTPRDIDSISEDSLQSLEKLLKGGQNQTKAKFLKRYLTPDEELTQAEIFTKIKGIKHPITGEQISAKNLNIPKKDVDALNSILNPKEIEGIAGTFARTMDYGTNWLKRLMTSDVVPGVPRVAFYTRNAVDLFFRRALAMESSFFNPKAGKFKDAVKVVTGKKGKTILGDVEYSFDDIRDFLASSGMWRHDYARMGIVNTGSMRNILKEINEDSYISMAQMRYKMNKHLQKLPGYSKHSVDKLMGTNAENLGVVETFINQLNRKVPVDDALKNVQHYMFDYANMTAFERGFMRRGFMFYTFTRQAIPFAVNAIKQHPYVYSSIGRLKDLAARDQEAEALIPDYIREYPFLKAGKTKKGFNILSMRNLFTVDVLPDASPAKINNFISQLNPLITTPVELMFGKDIYFNYNIQQDKKADISEFAKRVPGLKSWLKLRPKRRLADGKLYDVMDGYRYHALTNLWFSRAFRELDEVGKTVEKERDLWKTLVHFATGIKVTEVDIESRLKYLEAGAKRAQNKYEAAVKRGDRYRAKQVLKDMRMP